MRNYRAGRDSNEYKPFVLRQEDRGIGEEIEMFFEAWWQGIVFGVITTVGMLSVAYALMGMWKKYEGAPKDSDCGHGCDAHSHH